jgi:hypothetical protein
MILKIKPVQILNKRFDGIMIRVNNYILGSNGMIDANYILYNENSVVDSGSLSINDISDWTDNDWTLIDKIFLELGLEKLD